jgi:hypothetical protein
MALLGAAPAAGACPLGTAGLTAPSPVAVNTIVDPGAA